MPYQPYEWQLKFHKSVAKIKWVQAGRRSGKTRSSLQEVLAGIERISKQPIYRDGEKLTAEQAQLIPDIHVWTVAPTKAQMYQVWNEMRAFIPPHLVAKTNPYGPAANMGGGRGSGYKEDDLRVWLVLKDEKGKPLPGRFRWRVLWELKSADNPSSLQSAGLDYLHVTEAQDVKEEAWNRALPMIDSPGRAGRALIEGIPPSSPAHWFARWYKRALNNPSTLREAFHATYLDCPLLSDEAIQEINEHKDVMLLEDWERLYLAKQPDGQGAFFRRVEDAAGRNGCVQLYGPDGGRHYVAGLDLGRSNDSTVLVIKDRQSRNSVSAVELNRTDLNLQIETIKAEALRWNLEQIIMDSTGLGGQFGQDALFAELLNHNIPVVGFNFTPQKKYQLFVEYAIALEQGTVAFPADWNKLKMQLQDIAHRETVNRGHTFTTVSGGHDDWVDAECLALMACDPASENGEAIYIPKAIETLPPLRSDGKFQAQPDGIFERLNWERAQKRLKEYGPPVEILVDGVPHYASQN